jgi:hypothetical protein
MFLVIGIIFVAAGLYGISHGYTSPAMYIVLALGVCALLIHLCSRPWVQGTKIRAFDPRRQRRLSSLLRKRNR